MINTMQDAVQNDPETHNPTVIIFPMTKDEARTCADQIRHNIADIRKLVLDLYRRKGWEALGYPNFRRCVEVEFNYSWQYIYRLKDAAEIDEQVSPIGENIPESHARELKKVDNPQDRYQVYETAKRMAGSTNETVTVQHIQKAITLKAARDRVNQSDYKIVQHMVANDEITPTVGAEMVNQLERLAPQKQAQVTFLIGTHGLSCPALIPAIASMFDRESKVLATLQATGHLGDAPLKGATLTDLAAARREAQSEHIADNTPPDKTANRFIMTGDKVDMAYTARALSREIKDREKLLELVQILAEMA